VLAGGVAPSVATAAELPAIVTLLEGPAALLRGTSRYAVAEGVRLQSGDIVEVAEKAVAQVEFADGMALSLGPGSRLYAAVFAPRGAKGGSITELYLMGGWAKVTSAKNTSPFRVVTPVFGIAAEEVTGVVHVGEAEGELFVETGELRLAEGFVKATPASPLRLKGGEFYTRKAEQRGTVQPRPTPAFVGGMPKSFMDNLPSRLGKWKEREVQPRLVGDLAYGDIELWLKAPPEIRKAVMKPFTAKAQDPAFRAALVANLKFHPEWDRILFPEKYRPKPPPEQAEAQAPVRVGPTQ
jgi:hypothetical protein